MRRAEAWIGRGDSLAIRFRYLIGGEALDLGSNRMRIILRPRVAGLHLPEIAQDSTGDWFIQIEPGEFLITVPADVLEAMPRAAAVEFAVQVDRGGGDRRTIMTGPVRYGVHPSGWQVVLTGRDGLDDGLSIIAPTQGYDVQGDGDPARIIVEDAEWIEEAW